MRDRADNCVIICSIENVDPMGVHTGDSITVAPIQTLTDVEYQQMRDAAFACIRRVGVETGGSNVQFARRPGDRPPGRHRDEPARLAERRRWRRRRPASRSPRSPPSSPSATRSTRSPTTSRRATPASFEPVIDYVVTKIPRWAFEKLPGTSGILGTQMQSVGEAMAIGRTFPESLQKALRSLEQGRLGPQLRPAPRASCAALADDELLAAIARRRRPTASSRSASCCAVASRSRTIHDACRIDPWFLDQMLIITEERHALERRRPRRHRRRASWRRAKRLGFADAQLAHLWGADEADVARRPRGGRRASRPTRPSTPVRPSSPPRRRTTTRPTRTRTRSGRRDRPEGRDPRLGSEPHRPGHRVRLLLRARQLRPPRGRLRDDHGQLQPRDRVDRLRHVATGCTSSRSPSEDVLNVIAAETPRSPR